MYPIRYMWKINYPFYCSFRDTLQTPNLHTNGSRASFKPYRIYENQKLLYIFPLMSHTIVVCISSISPMAIGCFICLNINLVIFLIDISNFVMSGSILFKMLVLGINEMAYVLFLWSFKRLFLIFAGRQVHLPPCTRNNIHKYRICCHNNIITKKFIFFNTWFELGTICAPWWW